MTSSIADIVGKVPVHVDQAVDRITMRFADGAVAEWFHDQVCCEDVLVEDVVGDWFDLYGHPLMVAEERSADDHGAPQDPNFTNTWTFYTFRSLGGSVDVRWRGSSNGYYSEAVDFTLTRIAAEPARGEG